MNGATVVLSPHFTLQEMIRTSVRLENQPNARETECLRLLCTTLLEPIRSLVVDVNRGGYVAVGSIHVDSGYRCAAVNRAVGGAENSAHIEGRAADIVPVSVDIHCVALVQAIAASKLPFDKVIYESPATSTWVHVQIAKPGSVPRRQVLMCLRPGTYAAWRPAAVNGEHA